MGWKTEKTCLSKGGCIRRIQDGHFIRKAYHYLLYFPLVSEDKCFIQIAFELLVAGFYDKNDLKTNIHQKTKRFKKAYFYYLVFCIFSCSIVKIGHLIKINYLYITIIISSKRSLVIDTLSEFKTIYYFINIFTAKMYTIIELCS